MAIKDKARIAHILEASEDLSVFLSGKNRADLSSDKLLRYAVIRAIEIIGEASSQISAETKAKHPKLPWREAIGMRNVKPQPLRWGFFVFAIVGLEYGSGFASLLV